MKNDYTMIYNFLLKKDQGRKQKKLLHEKRKAREEGQVAKSSEVILLFILIYFLALRFLLPMYIKAMGTMFSRYLSNDFY